MPNPKPKNDWRQAWWPNVETAEGMKQAIGSGYWCAYIVAGITAACIALGVISAASSVDVAIMAITGFYIQRYKSRVAAIIAFSIFIFGKLASAMDGSSLSGNNWVVAVIIAFGLFNGIRGCLAYHSQRKVSVG